MTSLFDKLAQVFAQDIAIDLGTATTLVALSGTGIVIEEPSIVAINQRNQQILSVGKQAKLMAGRTPAYVTVVSPLRDGVISDFDATESMIRYFLQEVYDSHGKTYQLNRPRVVIGVPSLITEVETRAVIDAAKLAGAREVFIVEEPMAAAIGVGIQVDSAKGCMVVDIGGGTTDIAVISLGGLVIDNTIKIAGNEMDEAIVEYVRHKYNLQISDKLAETIKIDIGSAHKLSKELTTTVGGRDLLTGLPKSISLSSIEVREALLKVCEQIAESVKSALEKTSPESLNDIMHTGILLVGGGAELRGLDKYLSDKTKVPVHVVDYPHKAVVNGIIKLLDQIELLRRVQIQESAFI